MDFIEMRSEFGIDWDYGAMLRNPIKLMRMLSEIRSDNITYEL
jgi:hypothetical protein